MSAIFGLHVQVNEVHDADTVYGFVDHGCGIWNHGHAVHGVGLRLVGLNTRETEQPGGIEARDYVRTLIKPGDYLRFDSLNWDKYDNRMDVALYLPSGIDLGALLIAEGWAARWDGRGPKPVPAWPRVA